MADEFDETELVIDSPDQEPMEDEDLPEPDHLDLSTRPAVKDKDANREQVRDRSFSVFCLIAQAHTLLIPFHDLPVPDIPRQPAIPMREYTGDGRSAR